MCPQVRRAGPRGEELGSGSCRSQVWLLEGPKCCCRTLAESCELQGMGGVEAVIGWPGQAEMDEGWVNGPSALPDPVACPSQKHKLNLTHTGLALGTMGTLVRDTPTRLFAGLCRVVAGRHLSICSDGLETSWDCGLLQPKLLPVP